MTVRVRSITFDSKEPYKLARFWSELTGLTEDPDDINLPEHDEALLLGRNGSPNLLFIRVPEDRQVKNRVHLDLTPPDSDPATRDAELKRILALGATIVEDHRRPDGGGWIWLADPEGNDFCLERGVWGG
ncbi:MAG: VOC family protein [Streptosporangiaceae bacterium]|nr:VOC family protein [Streptosporangiaceae bacterium]